MSSPSAVPQLIDSLVTIFGGAVDVPVFDGPQFGKDDLRSFVAVGWDGADEDGGTTATIDQAWAHIGGYDKDEQAALTCAVVAWSGDDQVKGRRDAAFTLLSDCEQALRAAFESNGGLIDGVRYINLNLTAGVLEQTRDSTGTQARVEFTVTYQTWI